jgi:hypothetical protein
MKRMTLFAAPVLALLLPIGGSPATAEPAPARAAAEATVSVGSPNGAIAKGCHGHPYRYAVDVPAGESWALDLFLVSRQGRIASYAFELKGGDPKQGKGRFLFCSLDVRPGRYKLKAELTWSHYSEEYHVKAKTKTVRLRRP